MHCSITRCFTSPSRYCVKTFNFFFDNPNARTPHPLSQQPSRPTYGALPFVVAELGDVAVANPSHLAKAKPKKNNLGDLYKHVGTYKT